MPIDEDPGIAAWSTLVAAHSSVMRRLEAELEAEEGLAVTWYDVLLQLARAPRHRLRIQDLTDRVVLTQSGVSRLVDRVEAAGLVRRVRDDADRRAVLVALTDHGRRVLRRASRVHLRGIREHFVESLTAEELRVVRRALAKVAAP